MTPKLSDIRGGSMTDILRANLNAQIAALNEAGEFRVSAIAADPVVSELLYALELLAAPQARAA